MANIPKRLMIIALFVCAGHVFYPSPLPAARVTGEEAPAPAVAPTRTPPPSRSLQKRDAPVMAPQTLQQKGEVPAPPAKAAEASAGNAETPPAAAQSPAIAPAAPAGETPPAPGAAPAKAKPPAATPPAVAETKKPAKETRYVTIDFDNVDIPVFVKFVSELTGKNFVIDEKVRGKVTIISPRRISIDEVYKVFESVLEVYGFATVTAGEVIKIVPSLQAREKQLETRTKGEEGGAEDKLITQIITLQNANPDDIKKVLDPLISRASVLLSYPPTGMLVLTDYQSNIKKVLEIIGALDVEGTASQISYLPLKAASATELVKYLTQLFAPQPGRTPVTPVRFVADDRANAIIIVANEMDSERIKRLIAFMDKEVPRGSATIKVYRLQNAVAEDLAKVLMNIPKAPATPVPAAAAAAAQAAARSPLLSRDVQVVADKATNTLIITASNDDYKVLEEVIKSLDVSRPMVFIEALIMEVGVTKDFQVGVEWRGIKDTTDISALGGAGSAAFLGSGGRGTGGAFNIIPTPTATPGGIAVDFPRGFSIGVLGAGITIGGVTFPTIGAVLQAIQNDSDVSILSNPQITTLDNEEAEINVGRNVPYVTRQDTSSSITQAAGGINFSTFEYKDVGVILNITPHINEENFVRLKLNQKVSSVVAGSPTGLPTTLKREAKTTVMVKDKETIVIGGMMGDSTEVDGFQVPCLGNIPLFGWLFKSVSRHREKTNLYVFLTPHIIRTQSEAAALYKEKREQMGKVEEGVIKLYDKPGARLPAGEGEPDAVPPTDK